MKKYLLLFFATICIKSTIAQNSEPINTDRPDQSDGTYVLPKNNFQIEEGILFAKNNFQNNLMLRYGVTKSTEVRCLMDYAKIEASNGIMPLGLSFKQALVKQHKILPAIT
jgi:hypothetical protein